MRSRLFGIAYRMLGIRADAEDIVQEAWLRWHAADVAQLQSPQAWLVKVATRLSIDRLRSAKARRELYQGWWLPEPLVALDKHTPETQAEFASDLSIAFLHLLERLGPEERAAFLLRQVFDHDYPEIAAILNKSEVAVRQSVHRAAERVRSGRPRFAVSAETHRRLLHTFMQAAQSGERAAILALLDENATAIGDGGGKVPAVQKGFHGAERIANLYWARALRHGACQQYRMAHLNGEPGLLIYVDGKIESAQAFVSNGERVVSIYMVRNPDKLRHVGAPALSQAAAVGRLGV
ncbi:MAG: RNA polymerase sigma-70 factor [Hydrogenophaga sp.]|nr:RNA polymerase sigma-70 factor [Hydrogenophaga sp.]